MTALATGTRGGDDLDPGAWDDDAADARGPTWADAAQVAAELAPTQRALLLLLARLPLAPAGVLGALIGRREQADVALRALAGAGLVDAVQPRLGRGVPVRLWHPTDLGLGAIALDQGVDPVRLAARLRLRRADLLERVAAIRRVARLYDLLGLVARSAAGPRELLAWEEPFHRRVRPAGCRWRRTAGAPAYAALSWGGRPGSCLLWPDELALPVHRHREPLIHLTTLRSGWTGPFPRLVVAVGDPTRAEEWRRLLGEVADAARDAPLHAWLGTWDELAGEPLAGALVGAALPGNLVRHPRVRALRPEVRAVAPLPRPVGELRERGPSDAAARRARLALALEPADRALVRFLATNAACPALLLPAVLGIGWRDARRRLARLEEDGLVRAIGVTEVGSVARRARLLELTVDGLALAAADLGPTAELAWRAHGLSGGGPDAPVGLRGRWLAQLGHTLAVRGFAAALHRAVRARRRDGRDDRLVVWRGEPACWYRGLRPDGHGLVVLGGRVHHVLLEVDRSSERGPQRRARFGLYCFHRDRGILDRLYGGTPTILVVANGAFDEETIAATLRRVAGERGPLPAVLTTTARVRADPEGPLGPIWRDAWSVERRAWAERRGAGTSTLERPRLGA